MTLEKRNPEPQIEYGALGNNPSVPIARPNGWIGGRMPHRHLEVQIPHPLLFTTVPRERALGDAVRECGLGVCRQRRQLLTAC
jgi:hypothetical protein